MKKAKIDKVYHPSTKEEHEEMVDEELVESEQEAEDYEEEKQEDDSSDSSNNETQELILLDEESERTPLTESLEKNNKKKRLRIDSAAKKEDGPTRKKKKIDDELILTDDDEEAAQLLSAQKYKPLVQKHKEGFTDHDLLTNSVDMEATRELGDRHQLKWSVLKHEAANSKNTEASSKGFFKSAAIRLDLARFAEELRTADTTLDIKNIAEGDLRNRTLREAAGTFCPFCDDILDKLDQKRKFPLTCEGDVSCHIELTDDQEPIKTLDLKVHSILFAKNSSAFLTKYTKKDIEMSRDIKLTFRLKMMATLFFKQLYCNHPQDYSHLKLDQLTEFFYANITLGFDNTAYRCLLYMVFNFSVYTSIPRLMHPTQIIVFMENMKNAMEPFVSLENREKVYKTNKCVIHSKDTASGERFTIIYYRIFEKWIALMLTNFDAFFTSEKFVAVFNSKMLQYLCWVFVECTVCVECKAAKLKIASISKLVSFIVRVYKNLFVAPLFANTATTPKDQDDFCQVFDILIRYNPARRTAQNVFGLATEDDLTFSSIVQSVTFSEPLLAPKFKIRLLGFISQLVFTDGIKLQ